VSPEETLMVVEWLFAKEVLKRDDPGLLERSTEWPSIPGAASYS